MGNTLKKVAIIGTHNNPEVAKTIKYLANELKGYSKHIYLDLQTAESLEKNFGEGYELKDIANNCDVAVIVGGDGNFLSAARTLSLLKNIPIIGVNLGKLGFLTGVNSEDLSKNLFAILNGDYQKEERFMLQASVVGRMDFLKKSTAALNDIVITAGRHSQLFHMQVDINGDYAFDQRADGIIIATSSGSTAYALSAGGPIIHPGLDAIIIVGMFSHSLNNRPIVLSANCNIQITIGKYNDPEPELIFDGHIKIGLSPGDIIKLNRCPKAVTMLHPIDYNYFHLLRSKLHWNRMLFS